MIFRFRVKGFTQTPTVLKKQLVSGFTLLEMLLSIATVAFIAVIFVPVYQSLQVKNDLDTATVTFTQALRRAQVLAEASDGDTSSGVAVGGGVITIFRGVSFAMKDTTLDEIFQIPTNLTIAGISEIVFGRFTGLPNVVGTTTLTSITNETRNITINAKGTVNY